MAAKKRLFFGLKPDQGVHDQLVALSKSFPTVKGVRPVPNDNLHLTLQFLGHLEANEHKCLEQKMLQTFVQSFSLRFDLYGHFKSSQTLWLGCSSYPRELTRLVNHLKSIAESCGATIDKQNFKPHITLFKKVEKAKFPDIPFTVTWQATEFHLFESVPHENTTRYNILKTHPFLDE